MIKKSTALILALILVFSLAACGGQSSEPEASPASETPAVSETPEAPESIVFTDSAGREVEVPTNITRIAASGSMAQIVIFALAPDKLVGLAGEWGESAKQYVDTKYLNLPVLGQFYGQGDLNLEEVAAQDPQVIIDVGEAKSSIVEDMDGIMEQVGIPTIHIDATLDTMPEAYRMLGKLLGMESEAETIAQYCETVKTRTYEIADQVADSKVKLVYCTGTDGLGVIAKDSYHAEVIDLLADNAAVVEDPSSKGTGNPIDLEQLMNWNPDVIVFSPDGAYSTVASDPAWQKLSAIESGKYYEAPSAPYNWMGFPPSVNRYLGMIWLSQLLYPETANYDMYKETADFFKMFYHSDLSEEQYAELVANSIGK